MNTLEMTSELVRIEKYVTPSDAALDHTFSGLNGDTDGIYVLTYHITQKNSDIVEIVVKPNGITTNQYGSEWYAGSPGDSGVLTFTTMRIVRLGNFAGGALSGEARIYPKTGMIRFMRCNSCDNNNNGAHYTVSIGSSWTDTSTPITSLVISSDNQLAAGSTFTLYRMPSG